MTPVEESIAIISAIICIALLSGGPVFLYLRRSQRSDTTHVTQGARLVAVQSLAQSLKGLNFRDALNFERASEQITKTVLDELNQALPNASDSAVVGFQALNMATSKDLIFAKFPKTADQLLKSGRAAQVVTKNGEKLLIAVDSHGRKFISHARQVDPSVISKLSKVTNFVVGAAHIVAGYDNAKRIRKIDKKIDLLITRDANELVSRLEAIFECLKELSIGFATESDREHLVYLKFQLKELRCRWFRDVTSSLQAMENPDGRGFFSKLFSRRATVAQGVQSELSAQEEPLYLIRFSIHLEQMIANSLSEGAVFDEMTIPDIQRQARELGVLIEERKAWITDLAKGSKQVAVNLADTCQHFEASLLRGMDGRPQSEVSIKEDTAKKKPAA